MCEAVSALLEILPSSNSRMARRLERTSRDWQIGSRFGKQFSRVGKIKMEETKVKVKIRKGMLVIELPVLDPAQVSASGKRLLIATSRGGRRTSLKIDKKSVVVNVNAYIRPNEPQNKKKREISKSKLRSKGSRRRKATSNHQVSIR